MAETAINKGGFIVNKSELVTSIAEKSNLTKKDAEMALNAFLESVQEESYRWRKSTISRIRNFRS